MDLRRAANGFALLAICGICGCQSPQSQVEKVTTDPEAKEPVPPADLREHIRNNCASLLYALLNDEKHLSKFLLIKGESRELKELINRISFSTGEGAKKLEHLAKADRTLNLIAMGLPSGEAATRRAVAGTNRQELLHAKNGELEFRLLLTQIQALSYGAHLARVAAENEVRTESRAVFSELSRQLKELYDQVCAALRSKKF
jgi:hypothetical protein